MSHRDKGDKLDGFWWEGSFGSSVPKGWAKGRAGKAPRDNRSAAGGGRGRGLFLLLVCAAIGSGLGFLASWLVSL